MRLDIQKPLFSIVIPTYNRPAQLDFCMQSLEKLDYPVNDFEVIVVDDGGTVNLVRIIEKYASKFNLKLYSHPNQGCGGARNYGVSFVKGAFIHFTDDDCQLKPDFLKILEKLFENNDNVVVGGQVMNGLPENVFSSASQYLVDFVSNFSKHNFKEIYFFTGNNMALSTENFKKIGGFNTGLPFAAEDRDFLQRWKIMGGELVSDEQLVTSHFHDLTFMKFIKQHFNYGRGGYDFHKRYKGQFVLNTKYYRFFYNLIKYPISRVEIERPRTIALLLLVSQIMYFSGLIYHVVFRLFCRKIIFIVT